jgi:hypothetical protein
MKHDYKKNEKSCYLPGTSPESVIIPPFGFFSIKGSGNPNDSFFAEYIGVLYSLSYAVKMSPKSGLIPAGYFDYTVYPLEGIWDLNEEAKADYKEKFDKEDLVFNLMIRQPDFVSPDFALEILERTKRKKPHILLEQVRFEIITDGPCIQMLHIGRYEDEPESFKNMEQFATDHNLVRKSMVHREIYLSDARKVAPDKLRTVLRFQTH